MLNPHLVANLLAKMAIQTAHEFSSFRYAQPSYTLSTNVSKVEFTKKKNKAVGFPPHDVMSIPSWWFQPIWKILVKLCQIGSFPQIGMKIKNIWNHHLVMSIPFCGKKKSLLPVGRIYSRGEETLCRAKQDHHQSPWHLWSGSQKKQPEKR